MSVLLLLASSEWCGDSLRASSCGGASALERACAKLARLDCVMVADERRESKDVETLRDDAERCLRVFAAARASSLAAATTARRRQRVTHSVSADHVVPSCGHDTYGRRHTESCGHCESIHFGNATAMLAWARSAVSNTARGSSFPSGDDGVTFCSSRRGASRTI